jgi:hypothetical protein
MKHRLTPELQATVVHFVRAGGFVGVAAEAAGIPRPVFELGMRRGAASPRQPSRGFREAVLQARAQARLKAEMETRTAAPRDWLRMGPGRERPGEPGWSSPPQAGTAANEASPASRDARMLQCVAECLLHALEPFPEARAAAAEAMGPALEKVLSLEWDEEL